MFKDIRFIAVAAICVVLVSASVVSAYIYNPTGGSSITTPVTISNGGTGTSTGGVTGGVEYFNGSYITNGSKLTTDGLGDVLFGGPSPQYIIQATTTPINSLVFCNPALYPSPCNITMTTTGLTGIGSSTPGFTLDVGGSEDVANSLNIGPSGFLQQGYRNVFYATTTGGNLFVGDSAGQDIINTAVNSASDPHNVAIGLQAMQNGTSTVGQNTAVGYQALQGSAATSLGNNNTAVGYQALRLMTAGTVNTAVGVIAGANLTNGGAAFFGEAAGTNVTTGSNDTYIGWQSGQKQTTGSFNVAVGANTDGGAASVTASHNASTIFGYDAGGGITTGSNNVFLGAYTGSTTASGANNICIGFSLSCPSATANGSNTLDIGNVIYGSGLTSQASSSPAGSIGVASSTFQATLTDGGTFAAALTTFTTGDGAVCQRGAAGLVTFDSGVSSCIVSSQFVKHDIARIATSTSIGRILALNPVSFVYNDSTSTDPFTQGEDLGVIAEQAATVDPRYAQYNDQARTMDGHYYPSGSPVAINWSAITADLVNVVQSILNHQSVQDKEISQLQQEVFQLQKGAQMCLKD